MRSFLLFILMTFSLSVPQSNHAMLSSLDSYIISKLLLKMKSKSFLGLKVIRNLQMHMYLLINLAISIDYLQSSTWRMLNQLFEPGTKLRTAIGDGKLHNIKLYREPTGFLNHLTIFSWPNIRFMFRNCQNILQIQQLHASGTSKELATITSFTTDQQVSQSSILLAIQTQIGLVMKMTKSYILALFLSSAVVLYLVLHTNKPQLPFLAWNPDTWLYLMPHAKLSLENSSSASYKSHPVRNLSQYCQTVN